MNIYKFIKNIIFYYFLSIPTLYCTYERNCKVPYFDFNFLKA